MSIEKEVQFSEHITIRVTTPEGYLFKKRGPQIAEIRNAIEKAIASGVTLMDSDCEYYIPVNISIPEELRALFERIYVAEGGWHYLSTRYIGETRLFPPSIK